MSHNCARRTTREGFGYGLISTGLVITLFAMALDQWTSMRELELVSGCLGLLTSIVEPDHRI